MNKSDIVTILISARKNYLLSTSELSKLTGVNKKRIESIEKGDVDGITFDELIDLGNSLNVEFVRKHKIDQVTNVNFNEIKERLKSETITEISKSYGIHRNRLKRDLLLMSNIGKIDKGLLSKKYPSKRLYTKEVKQINELNIGGILVIKNKTDKQKIYIRNLLKELKDNLNKDFITRTEKNKDLLIVRLK